ncbi:ATP-binding cassette domain-containing protein [Undibacterium jejuense]|uniref:ATP-binding cassette domain-containing protein n=1 Tax=Undibacterium jejuense TaxID=1344949 RepID=A0A923HJT0_9BURK|nr:ATP-binding cassette domain-containing protein [Undibacterium jejuense]MBC3862114.1 ATP-binding cassette domain-containing protein [Undibacterium jejuense]
MDLSINKLSFAYPHRSIFWDFSFTATKGITWVRGNNGAGKTTLLKLLAGSLAVSKGDIHFNGINLRQQGFIWRQQCFWCSSETPEFNWLTLQEFFDLHLNLYPAAKATDLNTQLNAFGLLPMLNQTIDTLSLGQHKKMYLALALSLPVKLLLIDEPFNALDLDAVHYLRTQLSDSKRLDQQCILMTSHLDPDLPLVGEIHIGN